MIKNSVIILILIISTITLGDQLTIQTKNGSLKLELEAIDSDIIEEQTDTISTKKVIVRPIKEEEKRNAKTTSIENKNNKEDKHDNKDILIYNLLKKIRRLENNYISILDKSEKSEADMIIKDTYMILEALYPDKEVLFKLALENNEEKVIIKKQEEPISEQDFEYILEKVEKETWDKEKISTLNITIKEKRITLEQCKSLLKLFPFDDGRIKALEYLYPKVLDKAKGYDLVDYFDFISSKNKVKEIVSNCK